MPIYVYRCDCGHQFERLTSRDAQAPDCPECGRPTRKIPAGFSLGRGAPSSSSPKDSLAPPWQVMARSPERLQREVEFRQRLTAHPASESPSGITGTGSAGGSDSGPAPTGG